MITTLQASVWIWWWRIKVLTWEWGRRWPLKSTPKGFQWTWGPPELPGRTERPSELEGEVRPDLRQLQAPKISVFAKLVLLLTCQPVRQAARQSWGSRKLCELGKLATDTTGNRRLIPAVSVHWYSKQRNKTNKSACPKHEEKYAQT